MSPTGQTPGMRATVAEARRGEAIAAGRGKGQEQGTGAEAPEVAAGTAASLAQGVGGRSGVPSSGRGRRGRLRVRITGACRGCSARPRAA